MGEDEPMTNKQVADEFHVSVNTLTRLQNEGILPYWLRSGTKKPRLMWRSTVIDWRLGRLAPRDG